MVIYGHTCRRVVCSCGAVIHQCRCATPHKLVHKVPDGCARCRQNKEERDHK